MTITTEKTNILCHFCGVYLSIRSIHNLWCFNCHTPFNERQKNELEKIYENKTKLLYDTLLPLPEKEKARLLNNSPLHLQLFLHRYRLRKEGDNELKGPLK